MNTHAHTRTHTHTNTHVCAHACVHALTHSILLYQSCWEEMKILIPITLPRFFLSEKFPRDNACLIWRLFLKGWAMTFHTSCFQIPPLKIIPKRTLLDSVVRCLTSAVRLTKSGMQNTVLRNHRHGKNMLTGHSATDSTWPQAVTEFIHRL